MRIRGYNRRLDQSRKGDTSGALGNIGLEGVPRSKALAPGLFLEACLMVNSFAWPRGFPIQFALGHQTVRVRASGQVADIDQPIAPLIRAIWARNIETVQSCQMSWGSTDPNAPVWVLFGSAVGAEKFLRLAKVT